MTPSGYVKHKKIHISLKLVACVGMSYLYVCSNFWNQSFQAFFYIYSKWFFPFTIIYFYLKVEMFISSTQISHFCKNRNSMYHYFYFSYAIGHLIVMHCYARTLFMIFLFVLGQDFPLFTKRWYGHHSTRCTSFSKTTVFECCCKGRITNLGIFWTYLYLLWKTDLMKIGILESGHW